MRLSSFSEALPVPGTACRPITSLSKDCLVTVNSTSPRQLRGTTMQECLQDPREDPLHAPNQTPLYRSLRAFRHIPNTLVAQTVLLAVQRVL